jgi:hypothetical protein
MAKEDFRGSGDKTTTLLEARLKQSLDQVEKANGKPEATPSPF